jgi:membrane associated rhomboid family serine protease
MRWETVMGIYDREYYRREGPSFLGAFAIRGQVCKWLIIINIAVFVVQVIGESQGALSRLLHVEQFTDTFDLRTGVRPSIDQVRRLNPRARDVSDEAIRESIQAHNPPGVLQGQVWRLLTYAFLHSTGSLWHILFNMLFLWWFGSDMEDLYGPREFLAFYLVAAILGAIAYVLTQVAGISPPGPCLGASGAVTAVLTLCACHYPHRKILLFFLVPVPLWLLVIFQVAQDAFGLLSGNTGGTAVSVHLGGAAFAFAYYQRNWRLLNLWASLRAWGQRRSQPRLRVYREEQVPPAAPVHSASPPDVDEHMEAKVDAVLEKVARFGKDSLTDSERQLLLRASEVYKRRRT